MAFLDVTDLEITYTVGGGGLKAVDGVSFQLEEGQSLGVVGESGCGKTTIAKGMMQLLPKNGRISAGSIRLKDRELVGLSKDAVRRVRLKEIAMISQSAMNALNPVYTIGDQLIEGILTHTNFSKKEAYERAVQVFSLVGLEEKRLRSYPHQMSGGMKQRAVIAMALSLKPALIIADEPTTALDVVVQDRILQRILKIQKEINSSMIFITHDISVVGEICDSIMVMYGGKVLEHSSTEQFFHTPFHPYSLGLQNAFPSITEMTEQLISIPGSPPNLIDPPQGCRFRDRCPFAQPICAKEAPELREVAPGHRVACHFTEKVDEFRVLAKKNETWESVRNRLIQELHERGGQLHV
ncbi:MAG TPA: ABC transporter ATP-binding protein [Sphaerochaetaceae bacterium]|jgi:peptide/nickel transport system ATP-binding protein|nr:ABC transporter ATP-binding protein [Sphaerochaetaceae bacterium]